MEFKGINNWPISSDFGEVRNWGVYAPDKKHEGLDGVAAKKSDILCELEGKVIVKTYYQKSYGNCTIIKSDLGLLGKDWIGHDIYGLYGHQFDFEENLKVGDMVGSKDLIGYMGNSGFCISGGKVVTPEQQADPTFTGGVHCHLTFYSLERTIFDKFDSIEKGCAFL
jgi:murein DD-endopeptidase MepM/ murein hydrolase activator NlpD